MKFGRMFPLVLVEVTLACLWHVVVPTKQMTRGQM